MTHFSPNDNPQFTRLNKNQQDQLMQQKQLKCTSQLMLLDSHHQTTIMALKLPKLPATTSTFMVANSYLLNNSFWESLSTVISKRAMH
jgi:hypothetical protein